MEQGQRRVALFDAYPHVYSGAQKVDHLLARRLPEVGWELTLFTPGTGVLVDRVAADGLSHRVVEVPRSLGVYGRRTVGWRAAVAALAVPAYWLRLARAFRAQEVEVVHAVGHRGAVLAGPAARLAGLPLVWHVQGLMRTRVLNAVGSRLAAVVAMPARSLLRLMPGLERRAPVVEVPNVVPDSARHGDPGELAPGPHVMTSARIHPDKGLDVLIDALALVRRRVPGARLTVLGGEQDGWHHLRPELLDRARRLGLEDAVRFAGHVEDPELALREGRVYVQPSRERTEAHPLAVLEAMATGLPVVATDVGGVRDVVRDDDTGLLVPPEDVDALAGALVRVLDDAEVAERLRRSAFELVSERRFTELGLVESFADLYDRVAR